MHFFFIPGLPQQHVVKLRPGLDTFLKEASRIYDLFIYTHGTRLYAEQIAKIIDPDDSYFHHRIVARTDTPDMVHKSLKLLFPSCDDSMIMVLDDRIDVWKVTTVRSRILLLSCLRRQRDDSFFLLCLVAGEQENEGSVFLIEPYHFFKCTVEINNASGNGALGIEADDSDSTVDNHLQHTLAVLKNVHEEFFEGYDSGMTGRSADDQLAGKGRDVKAILSNVSLLDGCDCSFCLWLMVCCTCVVMMISKNEPYCKAATLSSAASFPLLALEVTSRTICGDLQLSSALFPAWSCKISQSLILLYTLNASAPRSTSRYVNLACGCAFIVEPVHLTSISCVLGQGDFGCVRGDT